MTDRCSWCGSPIEQKATGRRRRFCSDACKKRQQRAFPPMPSGMSPLPDPGPMPRRSPDERFAILLSDLRLIQAEAIELMSLLTSEHAWKAGHIADAVQRMLDYCFGRKP